MAVQRSRFSSSKRIIHLAINRFSGHSDRDASISSFHHDIKDENTFASEGNVDISEVYLDLALEQGEMIRTESKERPGRDCC